MADRSDPISAFAVHSKRKNLESSSKHKKSKKARTSSGSVTTIETVVKKGKTKRSKKLSKYANGGKAAASANSKSSSPKKIAVRAKSASPRLLKNAKAKVETESDLEEANEWVDTSSVNDAPKSLHNGTSKASKVKKGKVVSKKVLAKKPVSNSTKKQKKAIPVVEKSDSESDGTEDEPNTHSADDGRKLFEWLISPYDVDNFFKFSWEKAPLIVRRNQPNYYKHIISTPLLHSILKNSCVYFTKNVDITSYVDGKRETHNPVGRALPSVVWDYYMNGCSVRMLNPQTFIPKLHTLNATLQEYFGCFVGANSYLTPPNSQGFAPHFDDIEAFILQIEGKKRWKLYKARSENEFLPRFSSKNFDQSDIGVPIMDTVLSAGDLLYFPRGTIHQGETIDNTHSLHITLSVYQQNSWGDFLEKVFPNALQQAITNDVEFREGMPIGFLRHVGMAYSGVDSGTRRAVVARTKYLLNKMIQHIDVDTAADEMAKKHIHDFLPPVLTDAEKQCSVYEDGEKMLAEGQVINRVEIEPDTRVRLVRAYCVRLVEEEGELKLYYSTENSKEYHEFEPQVLEISRELAPAIEEIIARYPDYVKVEDLPIEGEDDKIQVVKDLWEKGIVVSEQPLPALE